MTTRPRAADPRAAPPAAHPAVMVLDDGTAAARRAVEWATWSTDRLHGRLTVSDVDTDDPAAGDVTVARAAAAAAEILVVAVGDRATAPSDPTGAAATCLTHAGCPVLAVHADDPRPPTGPAEIVVGVDGSPASSRALEWADLLTRGRGDDLDCVTVLGAPEWVFLPGHQRVDDTVGDALDRATRAVLGGRRVGVHAIVEHGDAVRVLARRSRFADLVVVGTHRAAPGDTTGSVGLRCVAQAHTPVLVVP